MDFAPEKKVCATCADWEGPREWSTAAQVFQVKAGAKGRCGRHQKLKPLQGGCADWTPAPSVSLPDLAEKEST